jgi:aldose 1-epimerase
MTTSSFLNLAKGKATCQIAPDHGGSILSLDYDGVPVMRRAVGDGPLDMACFPLVPFANRIAHGRFAFNHVEHRIAVDHLGAPHAIHGNGWRRAWLVEASGEDHATLRLDDDAGDWPWPYTAWQSFTLDEDGLSVELTIENRHASEAMPAGFGLHPYFPRFPESAITATSDVMWFNDATGLAQSPQDSILFSGASVPVEAFEGLDNFFVAPDAVVTITGGPVGVAISGPGAGFHLYCPGDHDFFCVEPVSHAPNSFGRGEWGEADILAPGQRRSQTYRFTFQP